MEERLLSALEVAKLTGVKTRKLRYLSDTGKLVPARTTDTGYRYYRQDQVVELLKILKKQAIVAYEATYFNKGLELFQNEIEQEIKEKTEQLAGEVQKYIFTDEITPIYDLWTGNIENSNMEYLIKQAAKGLVIKIVIRDKKQFIPGDYKEFKKWLGYLGCELLDLNDLKQLEVDKDADQGNKGNN